MKGAQMIMIQPVNTLSKPELEKQLSELCRQYEDVKGKGLKLNMARGKPAASQLVRLRTGRMPGITGSLTESVSAGSFLQICLALRRSR